MMKSHMWRSWSRQIVLFVCAALLCIGLTGSCSREPAGPPEKVTIACPRGLPPGLFYIAREKGFFQAAGVEVVFLPSIYGKAAIQNVIEGKADLAVAGDTPFVLAVNSGHRLYVLAVVGSTEKYNAIVGRRDRGITRPDDLRGKRIGAAFGTTAHFFLDSFLSAHGIGPDEVKIVDINPGRDAQVAIADGRVDAISYWSYFARQMAQGLGEKGVIFFDEALYNDTWGLFGKQDYVKANPDRIRRVLKALLDAQRSVARYPREARELVAKATGAERSVVDEAWETMDFRVSLDQSLLVNFEDQTRWAQRNHLIENGTMPNFLNYIYVDGLKSLEPRTVRIIR